MLEFLLSCPLHIHVKLINVLNVAEGNSPYHVNLTEFYDNSGITYKGINSQVLLSSL